MLPTLNRDVVIEYLLGASHEGMQVIFLEFEFDHVEAKAYINQIGLSL